MWPDGLRGLAESWVGNALLAATALSFLLYLAVSALAFLEAWRQRRRARIADRLSLFESDLAPAVTVLVAARDEAGAIADTVRGLLALRYPSVEIVVVNDGSTDATLATLVASFGLRRARRTLRARVDRRRVRGLWSSPQRPQLLVVDALRGGRSRALNVGLAYARHPLVLALDGDTVLERGALLQMALPFYEDAAVLAVAGVARPSNGCVLRGGEVVAVRRPARGLARARVVEALRTTLAGRLGWHLLDSLFLVTGAPVLFSREAVVAAGGWRPGLAAGDTDLVMRLQRRAARRGRRMAVRVAAQAVAWRPEPESLAEAFARIAADQRATAEALWLNRELLFNARFTFHHGFAFLVQVGVELLGPLAELTATALAAGLVAFGLLEVPFAMVFLALLVVGGTLASLLGLGLERVTCPRFKRRKDLEGVALDALLENFGHRQFAALARAWGLAGALLGAGVRSATRARPRQRPARRFDRAA